MGALILNIDTALDTASVSLAEDGKLLLFSKNKSRNDHASWLHKAIEELVKPMPAGFHGLQAVGVNDGPGSYTGLRIGLSAAKGLCYALQIPLITANSLEVMALGSILDLKVNEADWDLADWLLCPMIDARRMEVFTAVYDADLNEIMKPMALVLDERTIDRLAGRRKILFLGNGSVKFQQICHDPRAMFKTFSLNPVALASLTYRNFVGNNFAGLIYTEPLYLKEFFTKPPSGL